jgi:hypothetical protein
MNAEQRLGMAGSALSYARVYMDSTPLRHQAAYRLLSRFGVESPNYYWKVLAAEQIMRLFRQDRGQLDLLATLHREKASAEDVLHPENETKVFDHPGSLSDATATGVIVPLPNDPARYGFRVDPGMGPHCTQPDSHSTCCGATAGRTRRARSSSC